MQYTQFYDSPFGRIVLACDDVGLTGLWFDDGRGKALPDEEYEEAPHPHHAAASRWLDDYFERKDPGFLPPLHLSEAQTRLYRNGVKLRLNDLKLLSGERFAVYGTPDGFLGTAIADREEQILRVERNLKDPQTT